MKITEFGFVSTPPIPSNCDCLHLVDAGRCSGRHPRLEISSNHSDSKCKLPLTATANPPFQLALVGAWRWGAWVDLTPHVLWKIVGWGQLCVKPSGREEDGLWDLLALQHVETGHVLLQGPDTKTVAVLAVESPLLSVGCRGFLLLLPVLRGTQATPLWLVLWSQKNRKTQGWSLPSPTCSWDIPRREARRIVLPFGKQRDLCLACKLRSSGVKMFQVNGH